MEVKDWKRSKRKDKQKFQMAMHSENSQRCRKNFLLADSTTKCSYKVWDAGWTFSYQHLNLRTNTLLL